MKAMDGSHKCFAFLVGFLLGILASAPTAAASPQRLILDSFAAIPEEYYNRTYNGGGAIDYFVNEGGNLFVNYTVQQTEEWGGFVDIGHIYNSSTLLDCGGSETITLRYNNLEAVSAPGRAHLRLILLDGSDCIEDCEKSPGQGLENYYSFNYVLDDAPGWNELSFPLLGDDSSDSPFWRTGWTGQVGNNVLDSSSIKGYRLEINIDGEGEAMSTASGAVAFSFLSCDGNNMLAQSLEKESWKVATDTGAWYSRFYNSPLAEQLTTVTFVESDTLLINYTVQQTEEWGGFVDFGHITPSRSSLYDFTGGEEITLWYNNYKTASPPGRAHLRLILLDGSDCIEDCEKSPGQGLENYYSFNYVLDDAPGWNELSFPLLGDDSSDSPFWRTGWTGQVGNNVLDSSSIKGYRLEINIDGEGEAMSTASGIVAFKDIAVTSASAPTAAASPQRLILDSFAAIPEEYYNRTYNGGGAIDYFVNEGGNLFVNYTVQQTEEWGGFVDIGHIYNSSTLLDCGGSETITLRYNNLEAVSAPGRAHLRLILLDGSDCIEDCEKSPGQGLENYYSFNYVLDDAPGWNELSFPLLGDDSSDSPFWRTGWTGQVGNNVLDSSSIKGYRLEINIDGEGEAMSTASGAVAFSFLSCDGNNMLAQSLEKESWKVATDTGAWYSRFYNSPLAEQLTTVTFVESDTLLINYTVQQTEEWGGFVDFGHITPSRSSLYDFTGGEEITLWYNNYKTASPPGRAHLRLILLDGSDCIEDCEKSPGQGLENYYSFNYVLDDAPGWNELSFPLLGDDSSDSPFWRTGWTGQVGNNVLDSSSIKGYRLEINIDGEGEAMSTASGIVAFKDIAVKSSRSDVNNNFSGAESDQGESDQVAPPVSHLIPGVVLDREALTIVRFGMSRCHDICSNEAQCNYWQTDEVDCYWGKSAPLLNLYNADHMFDEKVTNRAYWLEDAAKRGVACGNDGLCECKSNEVVCSRPSLAVIPALPDGTKTLRIVGNNDLRVLLQEMLPNEIEVIEAGETRLTYVAPSLVNRLKRLDIPDEVFNVPPFGDECCEGETVCDIKQWSPCFDCAFEPFVTYEKGTIIKSIKLGNYRGEAASNPQFCGAECVMTPSCTHFTWDGRWKNSVPLCILRTGDEGRVFVRNKADDYSSSNKLEQDDDHPGYVSGFTPAQRAKQENATVFLRDLDPGEEMKLLEGQEWENDFSVVLGAAPLFGSVRIYPKINDAISVRPSWHEFTASTWNKSMTFTARAVDTSSVTVSTLTLEVHACDGSFTQDIDQLRFLITVNPLEDSQIVDTIPIMLGTLAAAAVGVPVVVFGVYKHGDVASHFLASFVTELALGIIFILLDIGDVATDIAACYNVVNEPQLVAFHASYVALTVLGTFVGLFGIAFRAYNFMRSYNAARGTAKSTSVHTATSRSLVRKESKNIRAGQINRDIITASVGLGVFVGEDAPLICLNFAIIAHNVAQLDSDCVNANWNAMYVVIASLAFNLIMCGIKLSYFKKLKDLFSERKEVGEDLMVLESFSERG